MKKILLISGHGAGDSGACAKISGKQYCEADENVTMVKKIKTTFAKYDAIVDLYPTSRNAYEDIKAGKCLRDFSAYDYVLEIHFNSCVHDLKGNGKTTGTELLLPTRKTYKDNSLEKDILKRVAAVGFTNRGIKQQQLLVINTAAAQSTKASLLEICFIDDKDDVTLYNKNKDTIASAIVKAFVAKWGLHRMVSVTKKAAFRKTPKVTPERICWIKENTRLPVLEVYAKWLKVKYNGQTGYVVKSKTSY